MSDSMKKFAELLSTNEEAKKELEKGYVDAAVKVAGKYGITLSASDFDVKGLSSDELKAVAGGTRIGGSCAELAGMTINGDGGSCMELAGANIRGGGSCANLAGANRK